MSDFLEQLAELFHERQLDIIKDLILEESFSREVLLKILNGTVTYKELPEEMKEINRKWGKKVLKVMLDCGVLIKDRNDELE